MSTHFLVKLCLSRTTVDARFSVRRTTNELLSRHSTAESLVSGDSPWRFISFEIRALVVGI